MADGSLIFSESPAGRISRVLPDRRVVTVAETGGGPNGLAIGPDGALYVCNNGGRDAPTGMIQRVEIDTGKVEVLYTECDGVPLVSPNDLVFDASGNFWFTDYGGGAVLYCAPDGSSIQRPITNVFTPNGVGLSPDGTILYIALTRPRQLLRRRLHGPGDVVPSPGHDISALVLRGGVDPDVLIVGLPGAQELDSLAVDASGAVCIGTVVDSAITVVSPDGRNIDRYTFPPEVDGRTVTNLCFGGPDMSTAFATLSASGNVISMRWPRPGLRLHFQR